MRPIANTQPAFAGACCHSSTDQRACHSAATNCSRPRSDHLVPSQGPRSSHQAATSPRVPQRHRRQPRRTAPALAPRSRPSLSAKHPKARPSPTTNPCHLLTLQRTRAESTTAHPRAICSRRYGCRAHRGCEGSPLVVARRAFCREPDRPMCESFIATRPGGRPKASEATEAFSERVLTLRKLSCVLAERSA